MTPNSSSLRLIYRSLKSFFYFLVSYVFAFRGIQVSIGKVSLFLPPRHFRVYPSNYEALNISTLLRMNLPQNTTAIDVGAHYGLYSVLLAKYLQLRVLSIEPTPYSFSVLLQSICMNSLQGYISPIRAAVSNYNGISSFNVQQSSGSVANSLVTYNHSDEPKYTIEVNVFALDSLVSSTPISFIKIDAEGSELEVLNGAKNIILNFRPIILLGVHPVALDSLGHTLYDVLEFINEIGYEITSFSSPNISYANFARQSSVFDVFLAPRQL